MCPERGSGYWPGRLEGRQRQAPGFRYMIAPIDGEAFAGVEPRIVEESEDPLLRDIRPEVGPRLVDQRDLIRFMGWTGCIAIGDAPFGDPAGFAAGAALRLALGQDVFLQTFPAPCRGARVSRVVRPGVGVNAVDVYEIIQTVGAHVIEGRGCTDRVQPCFARSLRSFVEHQAGADDHRTLVEFRSRADVLDDRQQLEILQIALGHLLCLGIMREIREVEFSGSGGGFGGQAKIRIEHGGVDFVSKFEAGQRDAGGIEPGEQRLEVFAKLIRVGGGEGRSAPHTKCVGPRPARCARSILQLDQPEDPDALLLGTPGKIDSLVIGQDAGPDAMDSGGVQLSENGILLTDAHGSDSRIHAEDQILRLCMHRPGCKGYTEDATRSEDVTDQFFQFRLVSIILTSTTLNAG